MKYALSSVRNGNKKHTMEENGYVNFKHKAGFINLRISNENKYKLSLDMYCLRRWGQWHRQSPCKAGARPTPAQI